jgi:hypothetical protein
MHREQWFMARWGFNPGMVAACVPVILIWLILPVPHTFWPFPKHSSDLLWWFASIMPLPVPGGINALSILVIVYYLGGKDL